MKGKSRILITGSSVLVLSGILGPSAFAADTAAANYVKTNGQSYTTGSPNTGGMNFTGHTHTNIVDGNNMGSAAAAMVTSDKQQTNNFVDSIMLWGFSENVAPYLNYPHATTGIFGTYFETGVPTSEADSITGASPFPGGNYNWVTNLIGVGISSLPFGTLYNAAGQAASLLLNKLQVAPGISTQAGGANQQKWAIYWSGVKRELDMSDAYPIYDDVNFEGYHQRFLWNGQAGDSAWNKGYVVYDTNYYYTNPNYMQVAYDSSGTMTLNFTLP